MSSNNARNAIRMKELKAERKAAGRCTKCGKQPLVSEASCQDCMDRTNETQNNRRREIRKTVLDHYGAPRCACCNELFNYEFLQLDHINGDGAAHRAMLASSTKKNNRGQGNAGAKLLGWIIRNNFPADFQVLCANCNFAKGDKKACPHAAQLDDMLVKISKISLTY